MTFKPLIFAGLLGLCVQANAANSEIDIQHWQLTTKVESENAKITDVNFRSWRIEPAFELSYLFTQNFYASAGISLVDRNHYNYRVTAGAQLPTEHFTPYAEVSYSHPADYLEHVTYDIGVRAKVSEKWGVFAELDDPIKDDQYAKLGLGYQLSKNMLVFADYMSNFHNTMNGAEMGVTFIF